MARSTAKPPIRLVETYSGAVLAYVHARAAEDAESGVYIAPGACLEANSRVDRAALLPHAVIQAGRHVRAAIVSARSGGGGVARIELGDLSAFATEQRRVFKPWGHELIYAITDRYCGKLLFVTAGEALSLQYHEKKDETIYVALGSAEIEIGTADERSAAVVGPGAGFRIRPGVVHRVRALEDTLLLEVSTPELDDVVRVEDRYGRV